ncbi:MAG: hypothetical protein IPP07_12755 [Holophagales bacterium]|nr:hypothetical protein [Holophagales bacterium]MBK9965722.1 hypothetical protein [Holophagales bacterium]
MSDNQSLAVPLFAVLGLGFVLAACGTQKSPTEPSDAPDPAATFSRVQVEVLTPSCALSGCHSGASPTAGQDLSAGRAYGQIVGVRAVQSTRLRIAPGDPEGSYLISKVKGDATISGSRMPLGGTLPPEKEKLLVDWVRRGAPND